MGRKASKWLCTCGVPWYTCAEHRIQGMACKFVQHKRIAMQPSSFRNKFRKIPLGVPEEPRKYMRRWSQNDHKNDCCLSQITGPENGDQGVEPKMARSSECLDVDTLSQNCHKRLRWKQPDPSRQVHSKVIPCKRSQPQNGNSKRPKLEGQIGRGNLIAKVVARNPNLAKKFPHLHDRPPDVAAQPLSTST